MNPQPEPAEVEVVRVQIAIRRSPVRVEETLIMEIA